MSKPAQQGFTVVETLIVMAIAGLILTMVLLMLPALNRNGNNNQRKQDVTAILSSVSHYQLTHSGGFPGVLPVNTKLTYFDAANVHFSTPAAGTTINNSSVGDETVEVMNYRICDNDNGEAVSQGAGFRSIVAIYRIEASGGTAFKCQDL